MVSSLFVWGTVIFLNIFSILIGFYSASKFIKAFIDGKDLFKYKGYLITAFLLIIIFPLIITAVVPNIVPISSGYIAFEATSTNGYIECPSVRYSSDKKVIDLNIKNEFNEPRTLSVKVNCLESENKCKNILSAITPFQETFQANPKIVFKLPLKLNISDKISPEDYDFEIVVKNEDGSTYDKISLTISQDK
ncbi:MAG: hypothetical protein KKA62_01390 [Nanoarchaeota archaeon]|nr:hypothetical protein [Nanoarchaeota archaeon]MBU1644300.1 hypothetical protein [Nanoarchaeota archaeon]MBU1976587.1 hypothetical protein [Nanoarchaeota archaeon]